jgi:hypothetical protein
MGKWVSVLITATAVGSALVPGVALGVVVSMGLAGLAGLFAARLHTYADEHRLHGLQAPATTRLARFCDDAALACCCSALRYAASPL